MNSFGRFQYLEKHRIDGNAQDIVVVVAQLPTTAGIDPRNLLIDRNPDDNVVEVIHD